MSINRFPVTETPLTPSGFNRFVATRADLRSDFQSDPEAVGKGRTLVHLPSEDPLPCALHRRKALPEISSLKVPLRGRAPLLIITRPPYSHVEREWRKSADGTG